MQADGELWRWLAAHTADATETPHWQLTELGVPAVGEVLAAAISGKDGDAVWFDPSQLGPTDEAALCRMARQR